jgi:hypothetical protein
VRNIECLLKLQVSQEAEGSYHAHQNGCC